MLRFQQFQHASYLWLCIVMLSSACQTNKKDHTAGQNEKREGDATSPSNLPAPSPGPAAAGTTPPSSNSTEFGSGPQSRAPSLADFQERYNEKLTETTYTALNAQEQLVWLLSSPTYKSLVPKEINWTNGKITPRGTIDFTPLDLSPLVCCIVSTDGGLLGAAASGTNQRNTHIFSINPTTKTVKSVIDLAARYSISSLTFDRVNNQLIFIASPTTGDKRLITIAADKWVIQSNVVLDKSYILAPDLTLHSDGTLWTATADEKGVLLATLDRQSGLKTPVCTALSKNITPAGGPQTVFDQLSGHFLVKGISGTALGDRFVYAITPNCKVSREIKLPHELNYLSWLSTSSQGDLIIGGREVSGQDRYRILVLPKQKIWD